MDDKKWYTAIPDSIMFHEELKATDIRVWSVIFSHYNWQKEACFPSLRTIIQECKLSRKTVLKARRKLRSLNLVHYDEGRSGKSCDYFFPIVDLFSDEVLSKFPGRY